MLTNDATTLSEHTAEPPVVARNARVSTIRGKRHNKMMSFACADEELSSGLVQPLARSFTLTEHIISFSHGTGYGF